MAKAFDAAGNSATASVTVSVSNGGTGGLTPSGPVTVSGQSGVTIQNLHITNPNGDCVTVTNSTNITIRQSEIGPCKVNGVVVSGGNTISVLDNFIHPEGTLSGCCDVTDGVFTNGTSNLTIQGNVIAYGEANIEASGQTNLKVIGNFLLNPRGGADSRGQNVQVWANNSTTLVQNNYTLSSTDTNTYKFAEVQEDSINFGAFPAGPFTTGVVVQNNYVTGGHSNSGCGMIADTGANSVQFLTNIIVNSGQCGIGIADGTNQVVDGNKILNTTPVSGGGNTGIYVWKVTSSDPACGPVQISNNVVSAIDSSGAANSFWNGGGCGTVTMTNNTFDAAALQALSPASQKLPPPPIPPQPANCAIASPFSNNTSVPACGSTGPGPVATPPTISISSPASGASVSGTISVTTNVSANTTSVQFMVDGNNSGAAVANAPFSLSLNTATLSDGTHSLTAVASNAAAQTATSAAVSITTKNTATAPPTVSITSPASGASVSGTISVTTTVSANTTSVQFMVDGNTVGAPVTSAPFSFSLNTTTLSNGSHVLTAVARNAAGQTTTSSPVVSNVNNPHLAITTSSLSSGQVQVSYSASLQATSGTPPYTWSVLIGQIPTGLTLSASAGTISGTPTVAGSFSFTIQVKDSAGGTASAGFSINIATTPPPPPPTSTAPFGHVFLVALENTNYTDVIGSSSMPYLNGLANQYGLATQYYADTHPSIGNYLMWATGQILTNDDNQTPASFPVSVDNAVREVLAVGKTWKQYAESIPSVGYTGGDTVGPDGGNFSTHHAPLLYLTDVLNSSTQLQNIVPFTQFAPDLASGTMPNYSFVTPNMCNDAHDCGLDVADNWLITNIDPLIKSAQFQKDGLLVIAFDESGNDNTNGGGRVVAIIISPFAKTGFKSTTLYQHESVLRLMLEGLGIKTLPGAAATAPKMWEFFTFTPPT
jgi:acid phosphatase